MERHSTAKKIWIKLYRKITGENTTPEYAARGWAIGMFCGFAIPIGGQLVISIPTAFLMKGSRIGAVLGTLATNHVSVFFIYPFQCWIGNMLIGGNLSYQKTAEALRGLVTHQNYASLAGLGKDIIISFLAGGLLFALISTPITYYVVKQVVIHYRARKEKRRLKREAAS